MLNAEEGPGEGRGEVWVGTVTANEVVVDVSGWFDSGLQSVVGGVVGMRDLGVGGVVACAVPLYVPVLNRFGVPGAGVVKGVALNVTAVNPADAGWLRVWPCADRKSVV